MCLNSKYAIGVECRGLEEKRGRGTVDECSRKNHDQQTPQRIYRGQIIVEEKNFIGIKDICSIVKKIFMQAVVIDV
jgi:hypothetical protein